MSSAPIKAPAEPRPPRAPLAQIIALRRLSPVPSDGLLALLVTDIEGFTPLVARLGDVAAQALIRTHNQTLRRLIAEHAGAEVAHTGDGFIIAFRSVTAALACAQRTQHALDASPGLRREGVRVRSGVHAGEPLREEERLFGQCVNVTVRVCSLAPAGRVLVTDVVRQLAQGRFRFDEGAPHALKGIGLPLQLYELLPEEPSRPDARGCRGSVGRLDHHRPRCPGQ